MNKISLEEMSGERARAPQLKLNEIGINGQTGQFIYRDILGGKKQTPKGERYETREIGDSIKVVFLKVRRKLLAYQNDSNNLATNEHNHKSDFVTLFGVDGGAQRDSAENLREKFQNLRTVQVVYALYQGELVRLFIKGSSLGSESKEESEHDFYSYISSFKKDGRDDHFYECYTNLYKLKEDGKLGPYYCMGYKESERLSEEEMKAVAENMKKAFDFSVEIDNFYGNVERKETTEEEKKEDLPIVDYGEEELNPEDIPF